MRYRAISAAALAALFLPAAVHAQSENAPEASVFDGDHLTIGAGGTYAPSYEGSDNMVLSAIPLAQGVVGGIGVNPRANGIAFDLIPDGEDPKFGFSLGPVITYTRNRSSNIHDDVVRSAGKLKSAIDLGVSAGVTAYKVLDPYDSLSLTADVKWNVNSAYKGMIITPSISYTTPISRAAVVNLSVYAKRVDGDYAHYYYDVDPLQSLASGLPVFGAHSGWATVGAGLLGAYDLDGNLLNGGFSLVALGGYSKLLNDARNTPYTAIRGDDNQWLVGAGVAYTF